MYEEIEEQLTTFFFCFPPPDFAGLDDGGGALSFFGAYKPLAGKF